MFRRVASLRAFQHRTFLVVWLGSFVSNIGTWVQAVALGVYVTETTGRAGWTGTVAALTYLPMVLLGPLGGAVADRVDRRRYAMLGLVLQSGLSALLAGWAFTGRLTVGAVGAVSVVTGCVTALVNPALTALVADAVPREHLLSAVSLNSAQYNLGRVLGPLLAAVLISVGGIGAALAANAVSFLAVLAALKMLRPRPAPKDASHPPLWPSIRRGLEVAMADRPTRSALWATLLNGVLVAPFIGLVPVMAIRLFGLGAAESSALVSSQGLGAIVAALLVGVLAERLGPGRLLRWSSGLLGGMAALYWLAPTLHLAMAALFGLGALYLTTLAGLSTRVQSRAPRELQARLTSLYSALLGGGYAVGVGMLGWLGDRFGLRLVAALFAGLYLVSLAASGFFRESPEENAATPASAGPV